MAAYQDDRAILEKLRQGHPLTEQERRKLMSLSAGTDFASEGYEFETSKDPGQGGLIGDQQKTQDSSAPGTVGREAAPAKESETDWGDVMDTVENIGSAVRTVGKYTPLGPAIGLIGDVYGVAKAGYNAVTRDDDEAARRAKEKENERKGMGGEDAAPGSSEDTGMTSQGGFRGLGIGNPSSYGGKGMGDAAAKEMSDTDSGGQFGGGQRGRDMDRGEGGGGGSGGRGSGSDASGSGTGGRSKGEGGTGGIGGY